MIACYGRPADGWLAKLEGDRHGFMLRLDQERKPEFWFELNADVEELRRLLKEYIFSTQEFEEGEFTEDQRFIRRWQILLELIQPVLISPPTPVGVEG